MFAVFIGLEEKFQKFSSWINKAVKFVARITLHIYIVQFAIIRRLEDLVFPLNFAATTLAILATASVVYYVEYFIRKVLVKIFNNKAGKENAESND